MDVSKTSLKSYFSLFVPKVRNKTRRTYKHVNDVHVNRLTSLITQGSFDWSAGSESRLNVFRCGTNHLPCVIKVQNQENVILLFLMFDTLKRTRGVAHLCRNAL